MEVDVRKDKTGMVLIDRSPQANPQDYVFLPGRGKVMLLANHVILSPGKSDRVDD